MADLKHVLLTKFNVPLELDSRPRLGINPRWLDSRIDLFRRWTLPSIAAQSRPPDRWLIFIDEDTPASSRSTLAALTEGLGSLIGVTGILPDARIGEIVRQHLPSSASTLISSRLDNDDALAVSYLDEVWRRATEWRGFINARNGLQFGAGRLVRRWDSSSPFLSLVEELHSDKPPLTAFCVEHQNANRVAPVLQLKGPPKWLQLIHGANLANQFQGIPYSRFKAEKGLGWTLPVERLERATLTEAGLGATAELLHELKFWMRRLQVPLK